MLEFLILLAGLGMAYFGIQKKNTIMGVAGALIAFAVVGVWLPNFYEAFGTLVVAVGGDIGEFLSTAFDQ